MAEKTVTLTEREFLFLVEVMDMADTEEAGRKLGIREQERWKMCDSLRARRQPPRAPASKLIAGEDIPIASLMDLRGDPFVHEGDLAMNVFPASAELGNWRDIVGVALRNIRKGEVIDYVPEGKTADVMSNGSFTVPGPLPPPFVQ